MNAGPSSEPVSSRRSLWAYWPHAVILVATGFVTIRDDWGPLSLPRQTDSTIYGYIGWAMTQGKVPYVDVWDNKGPLVYVLNYFGMLINTNHGIFVIGFLFTLATGVFMYRFARLFAGELPSVAATLLMLVTLARVQVGGNLTEGYAMAFVMIAYYLMARVLIERRLVWWHSVIIGAASAACFLLRINLVAPILGFGAVLFIHVLASKRVAAALWLVGHVVIGAALFVAPFLVYLTGHGALQACIDAAYTSSFSSPSWATRAQAIYTILSYMHNTYALDITAAFLVVSLVWLAAHRIRTTTGRVMVVAISVSLVVNVYANMITGADYEHYSTTFVAIMLFPVLVFFRLAVTLLTRTVGQIKLPGLSRATTAGVVGALTVMLIAMGWQNTDYLIKATFDNHDYKTAYARAYSSSSAASGAEYVKLIVENTTPADRIQVCGGSSGAYLLLRSGRESASKFFYTPDGPYINRDLVRTIQQDILTQIKAQRPKVVLIRTDRADAYINDSPDGIATLLNQNYERILADDKYMIYRLVT